MSKIATTPEALTELIGLIMDGHHVAYEEDLGDYYTILVTDDDGKKPESEIHDRYFDFDIVEED